MSGDVVETRRAETRKDRAGPTPKQNKIGTHACFARAGGEREWRKVFLDFIKNYWGHTHATRTLVERM